MSERREEMERMHRVLVEAHALVSGLYPVQVLISSDTAFAIGEAAGVLSKARALLGRDIDEQR
jgi:hypothetical protein